MLWAMLNARPVNTLFYLLDYLAYVGTRSDGKGEIMVGGIITYIARKFGVREDQGLNRIEDNNRLNIDTLIAMNFIKPHPPANITFELQLHVPLCLIILPNPSRTNPRWKKIYCMLVMTHKYMKSTMLLRRRVQTCTMRRSNMTMMPVSTIMKTMTGGHGCKPKFN